MAQTSATKSSTRSRRRQRRSPSVHGQLGRVLLRLESACMAVKILQPKREVTQRLASGVGASRFSQSCALKELVARRCVPFARRGPRALHQALRATTTRRRGIVRQSLDFAEVPSQPPWPQLLVRLDWRTLAWDAVERRHRRRRAFRETSISRCSTRRAGGDEGEYEDQGQRGNGCR